MSDPILLEVGKRYKFKISPPDPELVEDGFINPDDIFDVGLCKNFSVWCYNRSSRKMMSNETYDSIYFSGTVAEMWLDRDDYLVILQLIDVVYL